MRRAGQSRPRPALRRLEGIKVARGRHFSSRRRTPRPHLQSGARHPAGDAGRQREELGPLRARVFSAGVGLPRFGLGKQKAGSRKPQFMKRIAIIGGGISGLAPAFALEECRRSGTELDYVLYESSPRLGGVLRTEHIDGCLVEAGPDSFLTEKPWATDLCRALGLGDQLIGSNDGDRKTYILTNGRLVVIPDGLMFMVPTKILPTGLSPLFSWKTKLRMTQELFHPPRAADHDESVAAFVERHYGPEMVDRLADPLLSGVYGGEAAQLSVRAVLPRFAEMEASHGSLGRAMLAARKRMAQASKGPSRPLFTSLKDGMQQLVDALVNELDAKSLQAGVAAQAVSPEAGGWVVSAGLKSDQFDAVIVAVPTRAAAGLLQRSSKELASELSGIAYSSSVTVALGYGKQVREAL